MVRVIEQGKKKLKLRDKAQSDLDAMVNQLEESEMLLKDEQEELNRLQEQFEYEDKQSPARAKSADGKSSRPQTSTSQKSSADSNTAYSAEAEEFDNEHALDGALAEVRELTGIDDVDALVERITQLEERNFSVYNHISHSLEFEIAQVETDIAEAERELETVKCRGLSHGSHRQTELQLMTEKQERLEKQIYNVELQYKEQLEIWENAKANISLASKELGLFV